MSCDRTAWRARWVGFLAALMLSCISIGAAQTSANNAPNGGSTSTKAADRGSKKDKSSSSAAASDSEIAAAKAAGKVWVNLDSGIYHKNGRWYGKTKNGKFMSESEAKAAGYKGSKRD